MGLDVVDDADVEAEEEDLEVKRVFDAAKEKHRKIMTGMYVIVVNSMHVGEVEDTLYKCNALNGTNVGEVKDASMYVCMCVLSAICTVSRGHQLVAEGWEKFEEVCTEVGVGELPALLRYVKTTTTPTPTSTPTKTPTLEEQMEVEEAAEQKPMIEKPIHVTEGGKTLYYRCGNCDIAPKKSRVGMDSHIRAVHTKKALRCSFCTFSTYNFDSLQRHKKEHK